MEEEQYAHIRKDSKFSNYVQSKEQEEKYDDEEEEALSLCDLPINENSKSLDEKSDEKSFKRILRPSSLPETSELFNGFSSSSSSDMCPADDIIFRGKLVPFKDKDKVIVDDQFQHNKNLIVEANKPTAHRRGSESVSSVIRSNSVSTYSGSRRVLVRNSRSLDYSRLRGSSSYVISTAPEVDRNSSSRSTVSSEGVVKKATKPRWYSLVFGTMKVPPEMELNDIKNRQVRRNSSTSMFPGADSGDKVVLNRSSGKVSWRILKALSCKDHSSVAVTTSFALPQAST